MRFLSRRNRSPHRRATANSQRLLHCFGRSELRLATIWQQYWPCHPNATTISKRRTCDLIPSKTRPFYVIPTCFQCDGDMADALTSKSGGRNTRVGSSPTLGNSCKCYATGRERAICPTSTDMRSSGHCDESRRVQVSDHSRRGKLVGAHHGDGNQGDAYRSRHLCPRAVLNDGTSRLAIVSMTSTVSTSPRQFFASGAATS